MEKLWIYENSIVIQIYAHMDNREETCLQFLDQSQAFDRINHESLKFKMRNLGIDGPLLSLLDNNLQKHEEHDLS